VRLDNANRIAQTIERQLKSAALRSQRGPIGSRRLKSMAIPLAAGTEERKTGSNAKILTTRHDWQQRLIANGRIGHAGWPAVGAIGLEATEGRLLQIGGTNPQWKTLLPSRGVNPPGPARA
jgi:hypothetical protein